MTYTPTPDEQRVIEWLRKRKKPFTRGWQESHAIGNYRDRDMLQAAEELIENFTNAIEKGQHHE